MKQVIMLKETKKNKVTNAKDLFNSIKQINIDYTQENVLLSFFDSKMILINSEVVFKGGLNSCIIDPKTIFRRALLNNANSLIIAHNHPSNSLSPSVEDKEVYLKLKHIGEHLDLKVLDSIIFNEEEYYSLGDEM